MNSIGSVHAPPPCRSRGVGVLVLIAGTFTGACEPIRPSDRPRPPASARESLDLVREAEARVQVTGTVASGPVLGTHELSLAVVNDSRWTLTELRISVSDGDAGSKEYALRSAGTVGPGESETLSTVLDVDAGYGRPPAWRYLGATGYAPLP